MSEEQVSVSRQIEEIKNLRVVIDSAIKEARGVAEGINGGDGGREIALSITKLEEAKMWAGKALGALGRELPEEYRDEAND